MYMYMYMYVCTPVGHGLYVHVHVHCILYIHVYMFHTQSGSGGLLEVTVQYQSLQDEQQQLVAATSQHRRTHATLAVEVLRATGLKDAAVLAAQEQPVPLGFAAEVGTNNYAKISFPDFLEVSWDISSLIGNVI